MSLTLAKLYAELLYCHLSRPIVVDFASKRKMVFDRAYEEAEVASGTPAPDREDLPAAHFSI